MLRECQNTEGRKQHTRRALAVAAVTMLAYFSVSFATFIAAVDNFGFSAAARKRTATSFAAASTTIVDALGCCRDDKLAAVVWKCMRTSKTLLPPRNDAATFPLTTAARELPARIARKP